MTTNNTCQLIDLTNQIMVLQIMKDLQEISIANVLFHPLERDGTRSHDADKGGAANNGYSCSQSSLMLLNEQVANGYYKTVVSLMHQPVAVVIEFHTRRVSVMGCY